MKQKSLNLRRLLVLAFDVVMVPVAVILAFLARFEGQISEGQQEVLVHLITFATPICAAVFAVSGTARGVWQFASIRDLLLIARSVTIAMSVVVFALFAFKQQAHLENLSRSAVLLSWVFLIVLMGGGRLLVRLMKQHRWLRRESPRSVVVLGAGVAGRMLLHQIYHEPGCGMEVAFVLDDNPHLRGATVEGVVVKGGLDRLADFLDKEEVEEVVFAIPSLGQARFREMVEVCEGKGIGCRTLPTFAELADGKVEVSRLRPVTVEDLLGRDPVKLDMDAISGYLADRRVVVSGGGGSIGSELCRQIAAKGPERLVIFEHSEFNLYLIDRELRQEFPHLAIDSVLGDVKDEDAVDRLFAELKPHVVFHAAAYKHVPMVEDNRAVAVTNNVIGTRVFADAASANGCELFVMVSTDKAVNPTNVMGATKRIAEVYCQNLDGRSDTRFITTRFGNVLGSAGSVVPLFQKQIAEGGPVTVTHPEITRYFMTIPEAVSLILQAGAMGKGGEIFVLDMGQPVKIRDLAEQMIRLSGLEPGKDIEIVYNGLRPGEKLFEELFHEREGLKGTGHPKLMLAAARQVDWPWLNGELERLGAAARRDDRETLLESLREIVPEYSGARPD